MDSRPTHSISGISSESERESGSESEGEGEIDRDTENHPKTNNSHHSDFRIRVDVHGCDNGWSGLGGRVSLNTLVHISLLQLAVNNKSHMHSKNEFRRDWVACVYVYAGITEFLLLYQKGICLLVSCKSWIYPLNVPLLRNFGLHRAILFNDSSHMWDYHHYYTPFLSPLYPSGSVFGASTALSKQCSTKNKNRRILFEVYQLNIQFHEAMHRYTHIDRKIP